MKQFIVHRYLANSHSPRKIIFLDKFLWSLVRKKRNPKYFFVNIRQINNQSKFWEVLNKQYEKFFTISEILVFFVPSILYEELYDYTGADFSENIYEKVDEGANNLILFKYTDLLQEGGEFFIYDKIKELFRPYNEKRDGIIITMSEN